MRWHDLEIGNGAPGLGVPLGCIQCDWTARRGPRAAEARESAARFLEPSRLKGPILHTFQDGFMPFAGAEIKAAFETLKKTISPDLIFTHNRNDAHQDHRLIAEMTWNTFRNHFVLEYEIPKYDGDIGQPSVFVPLSADICNKKVQLIMDTFQSQHAKRWFQPETFQSLMRLRGMECNAPSGYAEAFYCRKLVI
jgi:LmbE family N-acetylglucosaminyl deacetylase